MAGRLHRKFKIIFPYGENGGPHIGGRRGRGNDRRAGLKSAVPAEPVLVVACVAGPEEGSTEPPPQI
jgi:hypothetical protein